MSDETATRGANERTPSLAQYFSWINNTNEGATEAQTLANLEFFRWLHDEYGMVLDLYAFDAGAIDGPGTYGTVDSDTFRRQFPRGFAPLAAAAARVGARLGLWCGPDGFGGTADGETDADEAARIALLESLCRDHGFALFKIDAVCGQLRASKRDAFVRLMQACRRHCPELIVLNHRIDLGHAEPWVTTFLFEGVETYIDVHIANDYAHPRTASHNRAGALARQNVPDLRRLTEDHGVCLSSCLDFWDDDLVLQAFGRCLLLAPEIYGNPWLLRDDEYPKLARIFNLHRRYRDLLVDGLLLPEPDYGPGAVSRGDATTRLLTLRNLTWAPVRYTVELGAALGLAGGATVELRQFHPTERLLGRHPLGATVEVEVPPFRVCLLLATSGECGELAVAGCDYEVVCDKPGRDARVKLLGRPGETLTVTLPGRQPRSVTFPGAPLTQPWHRHLGDLMPVPVPADAEALYEATCFAADNNALEVRCLERSGPTAIPAVQAARDAFFAQPLLAERGVWDRYAFDGDPATAFKVHPRGGWVPASGGCLRLDFGAAIAADELTLTGDLGDEPLRAAASADLVTWRAVPVRTTGVTATLALGDAPARYVRFDRAPTVLSDVSAGALDRTHWRASNRFAAYEPDPAVAAWQLDFTLDEAAPGSYLCVGLEGEHGVEGAVAALRVNGRPLGCPRRAPSYVANVWEAAVRRMHSHYTYYVDVTPEMLGQRLSAVVLVRASGVNAFVPRLWLTAYPTPWVAREVRLSDPA